LNVFDIVVPTYNNIEELRRCLESIETQTLAGARVVVCVDGSTDGTFEYLETHPGRITVLSHEGRTNRGRAATRNLALRVLDSTYTLFLDSDVTLDRDALSKHASVLRDRSSASVGAIRYTNTRDNLWARYKAARRLSLWPAGSLLPPSQFITANAALYTDDLIDLGGFDEAIRTYGGEDTELGFRLAKTLRRPIISNPDAFAVAEERKTLEAAIAELRSYGRTNLRYLHAKHPDMPHVFHTEKLGSRRLGDRAFVSFMNPITDLVVDAALHWVPFALQEQLINYKIVRAVFRGYSDGATR
jgi:glycosyltransferase involved in cell wall biosynthesis